MTKSTESTKIAENMDIQVINEAGDLNDENIIEDDNINVENTETLLINEETAGIIIKTPFTIAAAFMGDYWQLTEAECELMKPSAAKVFSDLFGRYVENNPELYMLCFTLLTCIGTRTAKMAVIKSQEQQTKETIVPVPLDSDDEV